MNYDVDLFGHPVPPEPPVRPVPLYGSPRWERLDLRSRPPRCGHCTMVARTEPSERVRFSSWRRVDRDGSVLSLCDEHAEHQRVRDLWLQDVIREAERRRAASIVDPDDGAEGSDGTLPN